MTNKYSLNKIRKSRNEFEALLRIYGISNLRLCKVLGVNYATSKKFIETPTNMRFIHAKRLADFIGLEIQDIVDTIVYDIK
tara:strand:+ start:276 stop:518 length:243 start_codon:yes stop_codon:yes gene_type:complete